MVALGHFSSELWTVFPHRFNTWIAWTRLIKIEPEKCDTKKYKKKHS